MGAHSIAGLAIRRSLDGKALLAVVALGVFVAATLMASAPIYARAMADKGLTFRLREELGPQPKTQVEFPTVALQTAEGRSLREAVEQRIGERLGWFRLSQARHIRLGRFGIAQAGEPPRAGLFQVQPQSLTGYEGHIHVVEGNMPGPSAPGEPMELALSPQAAAAARLKPGDVFEMREGYDTCERILAIGDPPPPPPPCNPTAAVGFVLKGKISGLIEPLDPDDPFWARPVGEYFAPFRIQVPDVGPVLPMFADERSILGNFAADYPAYHAFMAWNVFADTSKLNQANAMLASDDIQALYKDFEPLGGGAFSRLRDALVSFDRSASYQDIPLTVLLLEITGIALFYVALVSAVVVERQAAEIALLRSRGASTGQVVSVYLLQGLLIGVPAALLAPFLAASATALLGLTPTFDDVTGGSMLPVTIPLLSFGAGAVGAGLSLIALLGPALAVSRRNVSGQRRIESRPRPSVLHRYYLDLVLAGMAGLALFELDQRGSVFEPSPTGGLSSDPLLLASPALVIAAAAALLLRFYPMILRVFARAVSAAAGVSVSLGLAQVVRNSAQYTRLTLLLMMAVAVGAFAASYATTTNQSYSDRAGYETGADLRAWVAGGGLLPGPATAVDKKIASAPGVAKASGVTRVRAGVAAPGVTGQEFQVIGLDPVAVPGMLWWRDDFAEQSLSELLAPLIAPPVIPGRPLPGSPATMSLWVNGDPTLDSVNLWARLRDGRGEFALAELGPADTGGQWKQVSVQVPATFHADYAPPVTLVSVLISEPPNRFHVNYSPLAIDDITVTDQSGVVTVVEDFERGLRWAPFSSVEPNQDAFTVSREAVHSGSGAGKFTFRPGRAEAVRGFFSTDQILPLPAVVSESFMAATGLRRGSTTMLITGRGTLLPVVVAGSYQLFPTIASKDGPSLILNRDQLTTWGDTASFTDSADLVPIETFIALRPGADEKAVIDILKGPEYGLGGFSSRAEKLDANRRDPLIAAGGSGILFISFAAALVLVAAALLVTLLTSVARRRVEFAVVRSMGASRGQLFRMLGVEYSLVAAAGCLAGAVLGLFVGRQMLSFLDVTETGAKVEPGFILRTDWLLVGGAVGVVLLMFVVALALATRMVAAAADAQALRTE